MGAHRHLVSKNIGDTDIFWMTAIKTDYRWFISHVCVHACVLSSFSRVQLFATQWTIAHQSPLSMEFSKQEYCSGWPCSPPGDLPDPWIELASLMSPALAGGFFTTMPSEEPILLPSSYF